jgi:hypothetical protein
MMIAKTGSAHSKYAGLLPIEPSDDFFRPIDLIPEPIDYPEDVPFPHGQPSAGKRPRSLARFSIAFSMGVAVTLLWQSSYGDAARESIAKLYPRVGWLAARLPTTSENVIAPASPSADQLNAFDLDAVGRNVEKISTPIAPARQEPATRSTDQTTTAQEQIFGNTDQTAISVDQAQASKDGQGDAASLQRAARLSEAKAPQTLSEKRKALSAASGHDPFCFPSASAVLHNNPGGWATWTLRAPGHEGTMCWYATARHRVSDHRSMGSDYRREMLPEEIETLGTGESGLYAPFVPHGRGGSWEGGLP